MTYADSELVSRGGCTEMSLRRSELAASLDADLSVFSGTRGPCSRLTPFSIASLFFTRNLAAVAVPVCETLRFAVYRAAAC